MKVRIVKTEELDSQFVTDRDAMGILERDGVDSVTIYFKNGHYISYDKSADSED